MSLLFIENANDIQIELKDNKFNIKFDVMYS